MKILGYLKIIILINCKGFSADINMRVGNYGKLSKNKNLMEFNLLSF